MSSAPLDRRVDRLEEAMAELARAQTETKAELALLSKEMREFKDEMRGFKDEMRGFKDEMRISHEKLDKRMGKLTNQLGRLVEDIIGPSVPATFSALFGVPEGELTSGIRWHRPHQSRPGQDREFDAIVAGGDVFLVVGVRSKQTPEAVAEFASGLPEVRDYFPEWTEGRRILGAAASFHVDPSLVKGAEGLGLYVFGLERNLIEVLNSAGFQPRAS